MEQKAPAAADHALGFITLESELQDTDLQVTGTIPPWLSGTLLRNGPARFEGGRTSYRHWFDGQAMLHRFAIEDGAVAYTNRYLDTASERAAKAGRIAFPEFATDPCQRMFAKVFTRFRPNRAVVNANVNIVRLGHETVALTETPLPVAFDPETLRTVGVVGYQDDLDGQLTTAHPHQDPQTGDLVNYLLKFGRKSRYQVYRQGSGSLHRELIGSFPVSRPGYMHSFVITERYVVLTECPLTVNPMALLLSGKPFIDNYRWHADGRTRFLVMDSRDGSVLGGYETEPFFAFHHINAYEEVDGEGGEGGETLVLDVCAYGDASVVDALRLDEVRRSTPLPSAYPTRFRLRLADGSIERRRLADLPMELPRLDYARCNGLPYRYAYGVSADPKRASFADSLVKLDVETGETRVWAEDGCFPGEPVFVAAPDGHGEGARGEDQGVVLSVVLDAKTAASKLVVLDAETFEELATAAVPHGIPYGFHGVFHRTRA